MTKVRVVFGIADVIRLRSGSVAAYWIENVGDNAEHVRFLSRVRSDMAEKYKMFEAIDTSDQVAVKKLIDSVLLHHPKVSAIELFGKLPPPSALQSLSDGRLKIVIGALPVEVMRSSGGQRKLEIMMRADGLLQYEESEFRLEDENGNLGWYWRLTHPQSGLFGSAEEAKADAVARIFWLRDSKMKTREYLDRRSKIREILNGLWDPIGEGQEDEYYSYADTILSMLGAGATDDMLLRYLKWAEVSSMSVATEDTFNLGRAWRVTEALRTIKASNWETVVAASQSGSMEETLTVLRTIKGGDQLVSWLDRPEYLHHFGDDEIVSLHLDRAGGSALIVESSRFVGEGDQTTRITFVLQDIIDIHMDGFMHQNVIGGLTIRPCPEIDYHPSLIGIGGNRADHQIIIEPCAGAFGTINATIAEVKMTPPTEREDYPDA